VELFRTLPPGRGLWVTGFGRSMWPLLRDGDALHLLRADEADLHAGELVVCVLPGGQPAVHLLLSHSPRRTAGLFRRDDPTAEALLGRVGAVRRADGTERIPNELTRPLLLGLHGTARAVRRLLPR
jgi:mycothiol synthase